MVFLVKFYVKLARVQLFISKRRGTNLESMHLIPLWSQCLRSLLSTITSFVLVLQRFRGVHRVRCKILRKTSPGTALYLEKERNKSRKHASHSALEPVFEEPAFDNNFFRFGA